MKPQCNTSADCLRELARVMDQFGIDDIFAALRSKYCKWSGGEILNAIAALEAVEKYPDLLTCAIAEIEGKPVFLYDSLYDSHGIKWCITSHNDGFLYADMSNGITRELDPQFLSWNPPKPATVMVELPYDYARNRAAQNCTPDATLVNACKVALEKLKS